MEENNNKALREALVKMTDWMEKHTAAFSVQVYPRHDDHDEVERERDEVISLARAALDKVSTAEKSSVVGNAAKIQEALTYLEHVGQTKDGRVHFADIINVGNAKSCLKDALSLLSKPAENDNNGDAVITAVNNAAEVLDVITALATVILPPRDNAKRDGWLDWVRAMQEKARAALAAPPRNCYRFKTKEEAEVEFMMSDELPHDNGDMEMRAWMCRFIDWLFAPATEKKGETDGRE